VKPLLVDPMIDIVGTPYVGGTVSLEPRKVYKVHAPNGATHLRLSALLAAVRFKTSKDMAIPWSQCPDVKTGKAHYMPVAGLEYVCLKSKHYQPCRVCFEFELELVDDA